MTLRRRNLDLLIAWLDAGRRGDRRAMRALLAPDAAWQGIRPEWRADEPEAIVGMWLERAAALDDAEGFDAAADARGASLHLRAPGLAQLDPRLRTGVHIRFAMDDGGRVTGIADHASKRDAAPIVAGETPRGISEAPLVDGAPTGDGWFVVNLADAPWKTGRFGAYTALEGPTRWPQVGLNVGVLEPAQAACFYHREADQEDFLVLKGEALLLVEGEERSVRPWDFVHCPAWTEHVFVGAGDGPCAILAVVARSDRGAERESAIVVHRRRRGPRRAGGSVGERRPARARRHPAYGPRRPAHRGVELPRARARLRIRLRARQPLHDRRRLRHGERRAVAVVRSPPNLEQARQQVDQPRLRSVLAPDHRLPSGRASARAEAAPGPERRRAAARAGLRVRLQRVPAPGRWVAGRAGPPVPRQGLGAADHDRHGVPPHVPVGAGDEHRRCDPGDRASPAARAGTAIVAAPGRPAALARDEPARARHRKQRDRDRSSGNARPSPRPPARQSAPAGQGTERFYQAQLTIPGRLDVQGASLSGFPAIQIGHTRAVAWSHTTPPGLSYTIYRLRLVRGRPTSYLVDGRPESMTSRLVTVQVRGPNGRLRPYRRRLWSTRWGPVLTEGPVLAGLRWTPRTAFVLADAAATNVQALDTWLAVARARSAAGVLRALRRWQGVPWNHTLVADRDGHALFADIRVAPDVSDAMAKRCIVDLGQPPFAATGLALLDGSRSSCRWRTDPRAVEPGRLAPTRQPHLLRRDYVTNSNDSYWLSNPHRPLKGFPRIAGDERNQRSLRTRIGLLMTQARVDGTDGLGPPGFTLGDMQGLMLGNRQPAGEFTRDAVVAMCRALPGGVAPTSGGATVAVGAACDILAAWDLRENLDSRGAILFRRFWENLYAANPPESWWAHPFDPADPVATPNTLDTTQPGVAVALGTAITDLAAVQVPLDAAVGDLQHVVRNGRRIAIHGGPGDPEGQFNAIESALVPGPGLGEVLAGSSYVQVVTWNDGPCPEAATILTYSQSSNPRSPFFADQSRLFSRKEWVPVRFCRRDVLRHTLQTTVLAPPR